MVLWAIVRVGTVVPDHHGPYVDILMLAWWIFVAIVCVYVIMALAIDFLKKH